VLAATPDIDGILCLGDLVNYGPHPAECVRWAREETVPLWVVQGNHDRAFGCDKDPRCSAPYRPLADAMQRATAPKLSADAKRYLARLPTKEEQMFAGARFMLCHATPSDPLYAYLPPDAAPQQWEDEVARAGSPDLLFVGHTHLPFIKRVGATVVVNPGSVGQPKSGDPRACYGICEHGKVTLHRVPYDVPAVVRDLEACAPAPVAARLAWVLLTGGELPPAASA
jgi:protein phosphatase